MSLRQAKFNDHWRALYRRDYSTSLQEIVYEQLFCLGTNSIRFGKGLTAIIGSNGVGKSTLVAAVSELLSGTARLSGFDQAQRLRGSKLSGTASYQGDLQNIQVTEADGVRQVTTPEFGGTIAWLEPSYLARKCRSSIAADTNFGDHLEVVTPSVLTPDEIAIASYLVGKEYTHFEIFELSDLDDLERDPSGLERMPYFRVTTNSATYGSEGMGQGELALLLVYWVLRDLPKNSILVLDEPESHVSPRAQCALMNIIAKFGDERGIWTIVATHSPTIIQRIPRSNIVLIARGPEDAVVASEASNSQIASLLGGGVAFRGVMLVEDERAKGFLFSLLEQLDPDLLAQFEIVVAGSEAAIDLPLIFSSG